MEENNPQLDFDVLLSQLGDDPGQAATEPQTEVPAEPATTEPETTETTAQVEDTDPDPDPDLAALADPDVDPEMLEGKANKAFAQLRVQNKQYTAVMQQLLNRMGLDSTMASDPQKLQQLLGQAAVVEQAKTLQVPAELMQRIVQLEQRNSAAASQRIQEAALRGFKQVRDAYNLTSAELTEFAKQLHEAGTDPFSQEVDLDMAYRTHNVQKIVDKEVQRAVQEALSQQQAAAQHSTVPSRSTGKPDTQKPGDDEINTMAQFDRLLMSI